MYKLRKDKLKWISKKMNKAAINNRVKIIHLRILLNHLPLTQVQLHPVSKIQINLCMINKPFKRHLLRKIIMQCIKVNLNKILSDRTEINLGSINVVFVLTSLVKVIKKIVMLILKEKRKTMKQKNLLTTIYRLVDLYVINLYVIDQSQRKALLK